MVAVSAIGLAFAYFVEYVMSLAACPLCIYQRFPYLVFIMIAIIGLASDQKLVKYYVITTLFAITLASYHTGIERGIFELSALCKPLVAIGDDTSVTDFREMLYSKQIAMCNKPALVIFGLSMTEWNLLLNVTLLTMFIKVSTEPK
ncbi:MAG: disulfide bond formation protein B [Rickettsiaceae bacterium]